MVRKESYVPYKDMGCSRNDKREATTNPRTLGDLTISELKYLSKSGLTYGAAVPVPNPSRWEYYPTGLTRVGMNKLRELYDTAY